MLGFYEKNCVFLPPLHHTINEVEKDFLSELVAAAKLAQNSSAGTHLPEWAELFFLPDESELTTEIGKINEHIIIEF